MHVILDARKLGNRDTAHAYLKKVFSFPDYYGNNLDALHDCLTELPFSSNLTVHFLHAEDAGEYFPAVRSVFEELSGVEFFNI